MKQFLVVILLLAVIMIGSCQVSNGKTLSSLDKIKVAEGVYDDNEGNCYIRVSGLTGLYDDAITDMMTKKKGWEKQFPGKKVISVSVISGGGSLGISLFIIGLFIHYEQH